MFNVKRGSNRTIHSTAAIMQARPRGARLHDYLQQASTRGAAKEVRFPVAFAQMVTGSAAPITAASEMRRRWWPCATRRVDRAVG